jgi:hypothetical protein
MCEASPVTDDWITKGCHIHINRVELNVFTNHRGELGFRSVFTSTSASQLDIAIRIAQQKCLQDPDVRKQWIKRLNAAMVHMQDYRGQLRNLANGRMAEFNYIRIALERWKDDHGNA